MGRINLLVGLFTILSTSFARADLSFSHQVIECSSRTNGTVNLVIDRNVDLMVYEADPITNGGRWIPVPAPGGYIDFKSNVPTEPSRRKVLIRSDKPANDAAMIRLIGSDLHIGLEETEDLSGFIEFRMPKELFLKETPNSFTAYLSRTAGGVRPNFSWRLNCRARLLN